MASKRYPRRLNSGRATLRHPETFP